MGKASKRIATSKKLLRVAGLPAVAALFSVAPERVERLFFEESMRLHVSAFCAAPARRRSSASRAR